jgi:acetyl-CoA carboxylase biotin carboxyl carrier protein
MNAPAASSQDIFDVRKIRRLVELMKEHDLAELDLQQGEVRIQLRRACAAMPTAVGAAPVVSVAAPPAAGPPAAESVAPSAEAVKGVTLIKSPMVGTFYAAPDPDSQPFVKVGDHVGPETVVCIVEAMKVFNQIPAEAAGRVIAVLVENGAPVEFGQPLFKVDTRE